MPMKSTSTQNNDIVTDANEIDQHADQLNMEHKTEKTRLAMKNRNLAKQIYILKKEAKDLHKELAEARDELNRSRASLDAIVYQ